MKPTKNQTMVLGALKEYPRTARQVVQVLNMHSPVKSWTYDQVHGILRRMEDKNWVRRTYNTDDTHTARWEITALGEPLTTLRFQIMNNPLNDIEDRQAQIDLGVTAARIFQGALQETDGNLMKAFIATSAFFSGMMHPNMNDEEDGSETSSS